jgi:serine/threonine protein kinase
MSAVVANPNEAMMETARTRARTTRTTTTTTTPTTSTTTTTRTTADPNGDHFDPDEHEHDETVMDDLRNAPTDVLLLIAQDVVQQKVAKSSLFQELGSGPETRVPLFDMELITLGRVLGRGGFCVVREIEKIKQHKGSSRSLAGSFASSLSKSTMKSSSLFKRLGRSFQRKSTGVNRGNNSKTSHSTGAAHAMQEGGGGGSTQMHETGSDIASEDLGMDQDVQIDIGLSQDLMTPSSAPYTRRRRRPRYVVKRVALELKHSDKITFLKGTVDLAMEAKFLSALGDHAHIIELCGVARDGPFKEGYFIVLEKMTEILTRRIKKWMDIDRTCKGITGVFTGSKRKIQELLVVRLEAARDIASAAAHLHKNNVIFRDLKADNVGFDANGILKLFDFGLPKELQDDERIEESNVVLYRMTRMTGSIRYMAPEVGLGLPYNLSADVYSWAMLFWYMLALEPPFGMYTEKMIEERVFRLGHRPTIFDSWSDRVATLLRRSWDQDLSVRLSFDAIQRDLQTELGEIEGDKISGLSE